MHFALRSLSWSRSVGRSRSSTSAVHGRQPASQSVRWKHGEELKCGWPRVKAGRQLYGNWSTTTDIDRQATRRRGGEVGSAKVVRSGSGNDRNLANPTSAHCPHQRSAPRRRSRRRVLHNDGTPKAGSWTSVKKHRLCLLTYASTLF